MGNDTTRSRGLRVVVGLALLAGFAAALAWAFERGVTAALVTVGGGVLACSVWATIVGRPRLRGDDIAAFVAWTLSAIGSFFMALLFSLFEG